MAGHGASSVPQPSGFVLGENATRHRHERAPDRRRSARYEVGLLLGACHQRPRAHPQQHGSMRLGVSDLEALVGRAVLALDAEDVASGIEPDDRPQPPNGQTSRARSVVE